MNKVIILSVQPQWLHKILTGKKTIEIRKSMPKDCEYPIDVYLYCTKAKPCLVDIRFLPYTTEPDFKIYPSEQVFGNHLNSKIVAKFTLNKVEKIKLEYTDHPELGYGVNENCGDDWYEWESDDLLEKCCLTYDELYIYGHHKDLYAWHIDNLQIFDKPMELSEFYRNCKDYHNGWSGCDDVCGYAENNECYGGKIKINKPPKSWNYAYKDEIMKIIEQLKPKPLQAYIFIPQEIEDDVINQQYKKEVDDFTNNFIKENNCNKYNPHTEDYEYWCGINKIRNKYNLKPIDLEC